MALMPIEKSIILKKNYKLTINAALPARRAKLMKHDFENGTSYPMVAGEKNGSNIINRQFLLSEAEVYNEMDYAECGTFSEAPAVTREEVLGNIDDDLAADVQGGHFYIYEEGENVTYIFDWD